MIRSDACKMTDFISDADLRNILGCFSVREYMVKPITFGHINRSWHVECNGKKYILQCLPASFSEEQLKILLKNYRLYQNACAKVAQENFFCPDWEKSLEGDELVRDEKRRAWRFYEEIPGEILTQNADPQALGEGLARLHARLDLIEQNILCATPKYRELDGYYERYRNVLSEGAGDHDTILETMIEEDIDHYRSIRLYSDKVIHGDTKQSNAVFKDGSVIAWIDLDTLMTGDRCMDLADALRSLLNEFDTEHEKEDLTAEENVCIKAFLRGYQMKGGRLSEAEKERLPEILALLYFELGLRYYTDHIYGAQGFLGQTDALCVEKARKNLYSARRYKRLCEAGVFTEGDLLFGADLV